MTDRIFVECAIPAGFRRCDRTRTSEKRFPESILWRAKQEPLKQEGQSIIISLYAAEVGVGGAFWSDGGSH